MDVLSLVSGDVRWNECFRIAEELQKECGEGVLHLEVLSTLLASIPT